MKSKMTVLGLLIVFLCVGYVEAEENETESTEVSENVTADEAEETIKYCPVCGPEEEMHGMALGYKYQGKKYTFCSMGCLKAFKENPENFLKEKHSMGEAGHVHEKQVH